jgi:hypothetical protein
LERATLGDNSPGFIPPHGGCEKLNSYQMSVLVYDAAVKFCDRFFDPKSRTHDPMAQAARSGNKSTAEGSQVSGMSKKMVVKLVQKKSRFNAAVRTSG